jgi:uncharacterized membrane protein YfcA
MELLELSARQWTFAVLAALTVGVGKAGFAGAGMLMVLLMAQVIPPKESTGLLLPLLIVGDLFAVAAFRRHARWSHIWLLALPTLAGILVGFFLMQRISSGLFGPVIGWIVLGMLAVHYLMRFRRKLFRGLPESAGFAWLMGGLGGTTSMMANAAGPIMSIYLLARRLPKFEFVGTVSCLFLLINLAKLPFSSSLGLVNPGSLLVDAILVPLVLAGVFLGKALLGILPQRLFEEIVLILAGLGALNLIWG